MLKNRSLLISSIIGASLLIIIFISEGIGYLILAQKKAQWRKADFGEINMDDKTFKKLEKENASLVKQIKKLAPKGTYIVVDTAKNTLYLKKGDEIIRQAVISTGSGNVLTEPGGKRTWVFDTPRGEFAVKYKLKEPTWIKPDWAFIEEGQDIPEKFSERAEADVLGEYALGFGNGYFVHGTLYTRLLGRNVTHGCIRLGDEDLIAINRASAVGTKIYIF
ncbi:MAG TPA: L,D-transpeptidase family protein [Desulfatiglandales bacterium]|nr:L,D-transpeptidase family protein [Desulfatiglandales bacterium]